MKTILKLTFLLSASAVLVFGSGLVLRDANGGEEEKDTRNQHPPPIVVVAVGGADWDVVRKLWAEEKLPNLWSLADQGVSSELKTAYSSSPVIWTSVATGLRSEDHGITGFTVASETGEVPVSSSLRKAPALWNMASAVHRRVAVLGWWVTSPAEEVNGVMISDRLDRDLDRRFYPAGFSERFERELAALN